MNAIAPNFLKCDCPHCAGHVEYQSDFAAEIIDCPHCENRFRLPRTLDNDEPLPLLPQPSRLAVAWRRTKPVLRAFWSYILDLAMDLARSVSRYMFWVLIAVAVPVGAYVGWRNRGEIAKFISDTSSVSVGLAVIILYVFIYLLPTIIGCARGHRNAGAIFILNLFTGWTFFGWVAALIWAVYNENRTLAITFALSVGYDASAQSLNRIGGFSGGGYDPAQSLHYMNKPDKLEHPFRVIHRGGTNTYADLRPLFAWHKRPGVPDSRTRRAQQTPAQIKAAENPMPAWKFLRGEIAQIHDNGLLLTAFNYDADGNRRYQHANSFALTNYPGWRQLTDGKTVACFALQSGQLQFRDYRGITRTVPLYDHGLVYDPYAAAKSNHFQISNSKSEIPPTNTPAK